MGLIKLGVNIYVFSDGADVLSCAKCCFILPPHRNIFVYPLHLFLGCYGAYSTANPAKS